MQTASNNRIIIQATLVGINIMGNIYKNPSIIHISTIKDMMISSSPNPPNCCKEHTSIQSLRAKPNPKFMVGNMQEIRVNHPQDRLNLPNKPKITRSNNRINTWIVFEPNHLILDIVVQPDKFGTQQIHSIIRRVNKLLSLHLPLSQTSRTWRSESKMWTKGMRLQRVVLGIFFFFFILGSNPSITHSDATCKILLNLY